MGLGKAPLRGEVEHHVIVDWPLEMLRTMFSLVGYLVGSVFGSESVTSSTFQPDTGKSTSQPQAMDFSLVRHSLVPSIAQSLQSVLGPRNVCHPLVYAETLI